MYKKIMKTIVMVGLVVLTFGSLPALAEDESPVSASADMAFLSQYVWRGMAFSDENIIVQPSVSVGYGGFGVNLWGSLDTDYADEDAVFYETDLTLSYDWSYDMISMGAGYIYYGTRDGDTQELYFTVGIDTILAPSITVYRDIDATDGWYINLGIGHSIPLTDDMSLDLAAGFGYTDIDSGSDLTDGSVSASVSIPVNEYVSITPSVSYTFGLTSDGKDYLEAGSVDGESDHFFGGITCSIAF
ncbi:MAG: hypothetical protein PVG39_19750 [Desulfobacteraceae bacterium]|jgi:hypothetical protein